MESDIYICICDSCSVTMNIYFFVISIDIWSPESEYKIVIEIKVLLKSRVYFK